MLHVTTAGCETEETAESPIPMKPGARNCRTMAWQECFGVSRRQFIEFDIPDFSEKGFQDAGWCGVGTAQRVLVLDELFNGRSEFHWMPPNPKLETSRSELKRSFAQSAVIGCVWVRRYSVKLDSFTPATRPNFLRSTFAQICADRGER